VPSAWAWAPFRHRLFAAMWGAQFVVASRPEHLRQHARVTRRDRARLDRIREMTDPAHPVTVTRWLAPVTPPRSG